MGYLVNVKRYLLAWALLLTLLLPGCALYDRLTWKDQLDARFNPSLGQSKDAHIKRRGIPAKCVTLSTGEEVCEWKTAGVDQAGINCPPDTVYGGHRCQGGDASSWEHHLIFTYDQRGIAQEWSYWGSLGKRTSKDSVPQELPSQQVTAQISRNGSEKDANSQAIQEEVDKVGQGILYSIAAKALGNDYTISSQPGEVSGLIGHTKSKLIAVMGKPTSEDAISVDLSVVSYVTSRTTKTGQPLTCSLNYEISRTGERVLNRKTRCE